MSETRKEATVSSGIRIMAYRLHHNAIIEKALISIESRGGTSRLQEINKFRTVPVDGWTEGKKRKRYRHRPGSNASRSRALPPPSPHSHPPLSHFHPITSSHDAFSQQWTRRAHERHTSALSWALSCPRAYPNCASCSSARVGLGVNCVCIPWLISCILNVLKSCGYDSEEPRSDGLWSYHAPGP